MTQPRPLAGRLAALGAVGAAGIAATVVGYFEGRSLVAYVDPIGIPTICEGWTQGVKLGDIATDADCDAKTLAAIIEADDTFQRWVPDHVKDEMSHEAHAAFLSFIYNVGPGGPGVKDGFVYLKSGRHSTMLTRLRAGDIKGACNQLPYWTKAGGRELRGLVIRRQSEQSLCLNGLD